ncbi:class I adenylate-forming enzyme family protein [Kitasatospora cineracea]|uniref:Long-chain acyl-CoA synthetase n=1 Tax=Kitasatospora cineracea TaxID=88074 RepID=A0A8G1UKP2_9ACTN|nr:AMP-binding protein [Kitasatospora cineracea]ROR45790.1 long-chain acyl-CoA synthetase [Kitasatospora cineracea]
MTPPSFEAPPDERPWLASYPAGTDPDPVLRHACLAEAWDARVARAPHRVLVRYFDGALTAAQVDAASDALAAALQDRGVGRGDRVAIHLQSVPHYLVILLALWKTGAIGVPLNPMYRGRELRRLVDDCRPVGVFAAHTDAAGTTAALAGSSVTWVIGVNDRDWQTRNDDRVAWGAASSELADLSALVAQYAGHRPRRPAVGADDTALICYTSGTTGPPKGALNSHGNVLHSAANFGAWVRLGPDDVVLGIAPLFHISGVILNAATAVLNDAALVLVGRYRPEVVLDAFAEHGVTFTLGSITAFNALMALEHAGADHLRHVRLLYSGGAPVPPATVEAFQQRFGHYLHNVWGMTETTAGGIAVPPGRRARLHAADGTLSVGVPTPGVVVRVVDAEGTGLPCGTAGELEVSAPQVVSGYWEKPDSSAAALPRGRLRTGDVAVLDPDGWVYLVDRLKDQINTSGYKVWPREVEDALYEHPAVFEAAVVGEPDAYRGEAVVAHVSLKPGATTTADELHAFVRDRLAAYKRPRRIHLVGELPKTATGKIRREELRKRDQAL